MLALLTLAVAAGFVMDASRQIWVYGLSELYADQFRQYRRLIEVGIHGALLQPDNGHRQVFSNLVRWADLSLGSGDQRWGIGAGLITMVTVWGVMLALIWRRSSDPLPLKAAASLLVALALFWFGSGRMQFHGNESLQVYVVVACALLANASIAAHYRSATRWSIALMLGLIAMLSFATGIAVFAAFIALAVVLRRPWPEILVGVLAAALCILAYTFVLPGGDGVRNTVRIEPVPVAATAATWLGSAPVVAWLGLGNEGLYGASPQRIAEAGPLASALVSSAAAIRGGLGLETQVATALPLGAVGMILLAAACALTMRRPDRLSRVGALGLGMSLFAAALGFLVAIGRLAYFKDHPGQVLADRYVLWSALFWCGLGLYLLSLLNSASRKGLATLGLAWVGLVFIWTSHQVGSGWARASARAIESRAAQAQAGVLRPGWPTFADLPDLGAVHSALDFYRARQLAQFRTPRSRSLGRNLASLASAYSGVQPVQWWQHACDAVDSEDGRSAWHIAGVIAQRQAVDEGVVALSPEGRVVGLGEFGYQHDGHWLERIDDAGRGFDLFLVGANPASSPVTLWLADAALTRLRPFDKPPCEEQ